MYQYCKTFHCAPSEYENRPFKESMWLLEIDKTYNEAVRIAEEKEANKHR